MNSQNLLFERAAEQSRNAHNQAVNAFQESINNAFQELE